MAENLKIISINSWKSAQCMFYIRPLYLHRIAEGDYNTPFGVSEQSLAMWPGKWRHSGKVTCRSGCCWSKRDCSLVCFVQNIRYLVGTSDITTISNDWGNILQISCKTLLKKTRVSLCSANAWIGTHVTFPVIPKRCCHFLVVQSFQFEFATHPMYIQGKHSRSIDRKYSYRECWCYAYKKMFSAYKSVIVSPCACDLFVSKVMKITRLMDVRFWRSFFGAFSVCDDCILKSTTAWMLKLFVLYIFIHSCKYTTQHFK